MRAHYVSNETLVQSSTEPEASVLTVGRVEGKSDNWYVYFLKQSDNHACLAVCLVFGQVKIRRTLSSSLFHSLQNDHHSMRNGGQRQAKHAIALTCTTH